MKNFQNTRVSIKKDTNKVFFSSNTDASSIREGATIKIGTDSSFYTIADKESVFIIKPFRVINPLQISVENNEDIEFFTGDIIKLSFKEYTLVDAEIDNVKNDINDYKIKFGNAELNVVKHNGSYRVEIIKPGKHTEQNLYFEDNNVKIKLFYTETDIRQIESHTVENHSIENEKNILTLDRELFTKATEGKVSVEKWVCFLSETYPGKTKDATNVYINNFLTPLGLGILQGMSDEDVICNENFKKLEQKIIELEKKLNSRT